MTLAITKPLARESPVVVVIDLREDGIDLKGAVSPEVNPYDLIWPAVVKEDVTLPKDHRWNVGDPGQGTNHRCEYCGGALIVDIHYQLVCQKCYTVFEYLPTSEHLNTGKGGFDEGWVVREFERSGWPEEKKTGKQSWEYWDAETIRKILAVDDNGFPKSRPGMRQLAIWVQKSRLYRGRGIKLEKRIKNPEKRKVLIGNGNPLEKKARQITFEVAQISKRSRWVKKEDPDKMVTTYERRVSRKDGLTIVGDDEGPVTRSRDVLHAKISRICNDMGISIEELRSMPKTDPAHTKTLANRKEFQARWSELYGETISLQNVEAKVKSFLRGRQNPQWIETRSTANAIKIP